MTTVWAVLGDEDAEAVREENHWCFVVWPETDGQVTTKKDVPWKVKCRRP
jgi:hypothetical protein